MWPQSSDAPIHFRGYNRAFRSHLGAFAQCQLHNKQPQAGPQREQPIAAILKRDGRAIRPHLNPVACASVHVSD